MPPSWTPVPPSPSAGISTFHSTTPMANAPILGTPCYLLHQEHCLPSNMLINDFLCRFHCVVLRPEHPTGSLSLGPYWPQSQDHLPPSWPLPHLLSVHLLPYLQYPPGLNQRHPPLSQECIPWPPPQQPIVCSISQPSYYLKPADPPPSLTSWTTFLHFSGFWWCVHFLTPWFTPFPGSLYSLTTQHSIPIQHHQQVENCAHLLLLQPTPPRQACAALWQHSFSVHGLMNPTSLKTPLHSTLLLPSTSLTFILSCLWYLLISPSSSIHCQHLQPFWYGKGLPQWFHCLIPTLFPCLLQLVLLNMHSCHQPQGPPLSKPLNPLHHTSKPFSHWSSLPLLLHLHHKQQSLPTSTPWYPWPHLTHWIFDRTQAIFLKLSCPLKPKFLSSCVPTSHSHTDNNGKNTRSGDSNTNLFRFCSRLLKNLVSTTTTSNVVATKGKNV